MKDLYIAEKPSVAQEFARVLKLKTNRKDGFLEGEEAIVTWCVGHLVTMSYPESYDPALKKWSLVTLPFLPKDFKYEVIPSVKKQFDTVKNLLNREDVQRIYVCTDSGREGEYIYRLVDQMAQVSASKDKRRVWIDSQTEEEILRGIKEAKPLSEYDHLADAAYLRAKEDYLMGINFSRVLTLQYGSTVMNYRNTGKWSAISVGRVMTCVLGMVVRREREIRSFVKTPFYRVVATIPEEETTIEAEWKAVEGTKYFQSPLLYKDNGFKAEKDARELISYLEEEQPVRGTIVKVEKKQEKKAPPLLYNLAELQNECSRLFKISPDQTLQIVQELYEKKLVTYPRTDARVISTAVSKEITKNLKGLKGYGPCGDFAGQVLEQGSYKGLAKTKYVNDKQITDHYAIIPTGQGLGALNSVSQTAASVYDVVVRRFLSIFFPAAVYQKINADIEIRGEHFFTNIRILVDPGYLIVAGGQPVKEEERRLYRALSKLKKGMEVTVSALDVKEGETTPPKRYNSGSLILAMENAGQFIEDEELRAQIKGSGIGTSATRAEILGKLVKINYLNLNKKTQVVTPNQLGEMVFDVVNNSIRSMLNPDLTASWEKGLNLVADGEITPDEYMAKLEGFVTRMTEGVKGLRNQRVLQSCFDAAAVYYKKKGK
ncbi:DNA topoisomerase III [Anaerolentibacter hominis]|uniref:DNA topoisomerase III n=1 Tax=Anaerolentibacter hominis TaxID=3079009 RepID=UPI0031B877C2